MSAVDRIRDRLPQRRLRLTLDLGADSLRESAKALWNIAADLDREDREDRQVTSGGWASGYDLRVEVTDPDMDGDRYRRELQEWSAEDRRQRDAEADR